MKCILLTVGDELLAGKTVNTNASTLGKWLVERGVEVLACHTLPDSEPAIANAIRKAATQGEMVILTGGLGPTQDDKTRQAIARLLGQGGRKSPRARKWLEAFLASKNKSMSPGQAIQTWVPTGCLPLQNKYGTACGLYFKKGRCHGFAFPGVPRELMAMMEEFVAPKIPASGVSLSRAVWTWGWPESRQAMALKNWLPGLGQKFSSLPKKKGVVLSLSALTSLPGAQQVETRLAASFNAMLAAIPPEVIVHPIGSEIPEGVFKLLQNLSRTLFTAESCTGGAVAYLITSIPGSSEVYQGGVVTYSNRSKEQNLNVPSRVLKKYGAVSEQTVKAMVKGGVLCSHSDYCCATTGIAGPGGGSALKPVGTVWIGVGSARKIVTQKLSLSGSREDIRWRAAYSVLFLLNQFLVQEQEVL